MGTMNKRTEQLLGMAVVIGGFLCSLLLSRVRIHGLHMPLSFGLLLGSQLAGFDPAAIVGGIILASFEKSQPYWQGLSYALLYWGVTRLVLLIRGKCRPMLRLLLFLACGVLTLPVSLPYGTEELLYGTISIAVSALSAFCFRRICISIKTMNSTRCLTDQEQAAVILGIAMLLLSVSDAAFLSWSLPVTLIVFFTASAVMARGVFGAAAGILWTVVLTLYTGGDYALVGCIAVAALTASAAREKGKLFVAAAFFFSGLLFQTYRIADAYLMSVPNLLCGMLLFLMIPKDWFRYLRWYSDPNPRTERIVKNAIRRTERRASREVERMGKLLGGFSAMFHPHGVEEDMIPRWTVQGALAICRGCEMQRICWNEADAMRSAVLSIAEEAGAGKRVTPIDPICDVCPRFQALCSAVFLCYQQACSRNAVGKLASKQSEFVERQFSGAGAALCGFAKGMRMHSLGMELTERRIRERLLKAGYTVDSIELGETNGTNTIAVSIRRPLKTKRSAVRKEIEQACGYRLRSVRIVQNARRMVFRFEQDAELHAEAQISRTSEKGAVSGDATGECRIPGGRVCFALSDGMGSGKEARRESEAAIRLLFRLYHAGVGRELVYENVNRMLLAQNEAEMYATLDAVSIDLNTGEAELLKYGAPPSYIIRDGKVRTVSGEALPCGILADAKPSVIRIRLRKDDRLVLCSDGVQDVLPEGMEQAIQNLTETGRDPGEHLLRLARANGGSDDMTVMVIRVA